MRACGSSNSCQLPLVSEALPCLPYSPGPVTANPASSLGRQVLSTKSSTGSAGFGSSKRLADHASDVPGPGELQAGWGLVTERQRRSGGLEEGKGGEGGQGGCGAGGGATSGFSPPSRPAHHPACQERTTHDGAPACGWQSVCRHRWFVAALARQQNQRTL